MASFTVRMECDNDEFQGWGGIAVIAALERTLDGIKHGVCRPGSSGPIFDGNGNRIGEWVYSSDETGA